MQSTTYYCYVEAVNSCAITASSIWSFKTKAEPPSQYTYAILIPVVASAQGAYSSNWVTDLQIFNPNDKTINFSLYFIPPNTDGKNTPYVYTSTIEPKKIKIFKNIIFETFNLSNISGVFQIVPDGRLIATSRTYNPTENGTYGKFIKGYNTNDAIGSEGAKYIIRQSEVGHIIHLTNSIFFRTNIGFVEVLGKAVQVNLSIYNDFNNLLGYSSFNLMPMGFLQINDVFGSLGISGFYQSARAEITIEGMVYL